MHQGVTLVVGGTGNNLCHIAEMLPYLVIWGREEGPLFRWKGKKAVTREDLMDRLRYILKEAGIDSSKYSGHSFRIGAATMAAARGISYSTIYKRSAGGLVTPSLVTFGSQGTSLQRFPRLLTVEHLLG